MISVLFFFNDTATTEIYPLSLHDALPIWVEMRRAQPEQIRKEPRHRVDAEICPQRPPPQHEQRHQQEDGDGDRSEEHTSELQSRQYLVCRLLLEKKNINHIIQKQSHILLQ